MSFADRTDQPLAELLSLAANHQFFWKIIGGGGPEAPDGALGAAIDRDFGGLSVLKAAFAETAAALDGPGFAFVSLVRPKAPELEIVALPMNGSVLPLGKPGIVVCDLWPHAWCGDHPSLAAWIEAFWSIVDWNACGNRYERLIKGDQPQ